jgi:hypothetical protein
VSSPPQELLAEPFYIRAQRRAFFRLRLAAETVATLSRSFVTYYFISMPGLGGSVPLAFGFGQLAYGGVLHDETRIETASFLPLKPT